jgi:hypothetical protein
MFLVRQQVLVQLAAAGLTVFERGQAPLKKDEMKTKAVSTHKYGFMVARTPDGRWHRGVAPGATAPQPR